MYKIVLLGDTSVGKTSIRKRYLGEGFTIDTTGTLGLDFAIKSFSNTSVQVWDIAGHEAFSFLRKIYYRGAHGALLIYDISNPTSFNNLSIWIKEIEKYVGRKIPFTLVANKIDLRDKIDDQVSEEKGREFVEKLNKMKNYNVALIESSALMNLNIKKIFVDLISKIGF